MFTTLGRGPIILNKDANEKEFVPHLTNLTIIAW